MDKDVPRPWGVVAGGTVRVNCGMMFYTSSLKRDCKWYVFFFWITRRFFVISAVHCC